MIMVKLFNNGQFVVAKRDMLGIKKGDVVKVESYARPTAFGEWLNIAGKKDGTDDGSYTESFFEPWQPKVGERVRLVKDGKSTTGAVGKLATLVTWGDGTFIQDNEDYLLDIDPPVDYRTVAITKNFTRATIDCFEPLPVAAEAKPAALKIEAGKFYKTRDGRKVGPMEKVSDFWTAGSGANGTPGHFTNEGVSAFLGILPREENRAQHDLIAEWVDEPAKASNDNEGPTKPKFKAGDRVRIVRERDAYGKDLGEVNVGKVVTLKAIDTEISNQIGWEAWDVVEPCNVWWVRSDDVELVTTTPAIVCLIENGQPKPAVRPFVHPDEQSAAKEANRLAGIHKGKEFGVYVLASTAKEERTYDHEWQRLAAKGEKINAIRELRSVASLDLLTAKQAVERFVDKAA
jgi:hypothetical protein